MPLERRRRSSIDLLPGDIRKALDAWLRDPGMTHATATDLINEYLASRGEAQRVSRSAVGRYDQRMRHVGARLRESRAAAEAWIDKLGAAPQGQLGHLVNEILRTLAFGISLKLQEGELSEASLPALITQLKQLSVAAATLERASSENVKREVEIQRRAAEDLAGRAEGEAGSSGGPITPERLRALVAEVYGA